MTAAPKPPSVANAYSVDSAPSSDAPRPWYADLDPMVERVAAALYESRTGRPWAPFARDSRAHGWRDDARTAVAAMRAGQGPAPSPMPEWCGAGLYTPVMGRGGVVIVAESRRMCGLKEPHEWHQDRYDATVRWKALPPFMERAVVTSSRSEKQTTDSPIATSAHSEAEGVQ